MRCNLQCGLMAAAVALAAWGTTAHAGFIATSTVTFSGDSAINCANADQTYNSESHSYAWSVADGVGVGVLTAHPTASQPVQGTFTEVIDGDPTKLMTNNLYNDSGVNWIGYKLTLESLTPGVTAVFQGPATSTDAFGDPVLITSDTITYSGLSTNTPLLANRLGELKYSIVLTPPVGYQGAIAYLLTETPTVQALVPEPASLGLVALGALALLGRRRK